MSMIQDNYTVLQQIWTDFWSQMYTFSFLLFLCTHQCHFLWRSSSAWSESISSKESVYICESCKHAYFWRGPGPVCTQCPVRFYQTCREEEKLQLWRGDRTASLSIRNERFIQRFSGETHNKQKDWAGVQRSNVAAKYYKRISGKNWIDLKLY